MRRRLTVLLTVLGLAALGVTAVALASGGDKTDIKRTGDAKVHRTGGASHGGPFGGMAGVVLDSLATRLSVQPADLRKAIGEIAADQRQKRLQSAGLTQPEIDALKACRGDRKQLRHRDGVKKRDPARVRPARKDVAACTADAARSARQKLKAAAKVKPDLVALKAELAQSLATKLAKTPDAVLTAVRAELDQRLTQAAGIGLVTPQAHDLALACFDDPASCDLAAVRAAFPHFGLRHAGLHVGRG
ncbi:MAG TPA: hypothetical protein VGO71_06390 [Baekduia sp.]|jgi:hypothetical protein|nr:hypothetical protein [Baekduia sp.]